MKHNDFRERYEHIKMLLPVHVELVAVSKTHSLENIKEFYDVGHWVFGENMV